MKTIDILKANGLMDEFAYHDAVLQAMTVEGDRYELEMLTVGKELVRLEFRGVSRVSMGKYLPGSIVLSCFLWRVNEVPEFVSGTPLYQECLEDGPVNSERVFFLDSSYGAAVLVFFDALEATVRPGY